MNRRPLAYWLHAFFDEWLAEQRNCSQHTIKSYRDSWRLFLRFVAARHHRSTSALTLEELTADEVLAFLKHIEAERQTSIGTRNCRLAAIRSFYRFVADREPLSAWQCAAVLRIPTKKGRSAEPEYLDIEEVTAILGQPDRSTKEGQRDHALLAFLYNTGARIQEAVSLCPRDIRLTTPAQVKLHGKGRKDRICPLWPETADLLASLLLRQPRADDAPVFVNRYGQPLGAAGEGRDTEADVLLQASTHWLRHTFGTRLVLEGKDLRLVAQAMRHKNIRRTMLYTNLDFLDVARASERGDA
ncbi:tyrosine-type recombinase/integrase [Pollutimonas sp. H1-120]|uniref:tyrosine-type recombinase/integrase n=1 Tax=Pollutimonas sp. H1-120 TaxID=3148824 RepID=UPI003B52FC88